MKINQLLIFLILPFNVLAQLSESFTDDNFTSNPEWVGDTAFFKIDSLFELQSQGPAASSNLCLSTPATNAENTEWQFFVRMAFSPSTINYTKFYVMSDQADCKGMLSGYFVKIGGVSGSLDAIELYRQQGTSATKIIAGIPGHAGKNTNTLRVKIIRYGNGNWEVYSDTLGGNNFSIEGQATDTIIQTSSYIGLVCHHSTTCRDKFFFDDIVIKKALLSILKVSTFNEFQLDVYFSESVDSLTALDPSNYFINSGIGYPSKVKIDDLNKSIVHLTLAASLHTGSYNLAIDQVKDSNGIAIKANSTADFNYVKPLSYGALIIDEIFADPFPVIGLPAGEYVEIFNATNDTINLKDYTFSDPSTTAVLPLYKFPPKSFLILCSQTYESLYAAYGNVMSLPVWPALNNSGDQLTLKNPGGHIISTVRYSDTWYGDAVKKEGGWSLELIDPDNLCGEENNWLASEDQQGGTPGKLNSVNANKPDLNPPVLLKAEVQDSITIKLFFNEALDTTLLYKKEDFIVDPAQKISAAKILNTDNRSVFITLDSPLLQKILYNVSIISIADCNGNIANGCSSSFALAEPAESGDVIINEVLFNPRPNGIDFVEIYNRSDKFIDLQGWELANFENNEISNKKLLATEPLMLKPHEYLFFCTDPSIIKNQYPLSKISSAITLPSLPSYNDDEGTVILLNNNVQTERFDYNKNFHFPLIDDKEGVSLERISAAAATNTPDNWHSAASTVGYATPGYKNSQDYSGESSEGFQVDPKVFTPDEDGYKDFTTINYKFNSPGNMLNITIFDVAGREVKRLVHNQLTGKEGFFQWDGLNFSGEKVRIGYFVLFIQVFNMEGQLRNYKETVIVGSRQ
jgi:hypothetical protein